MKAKPARNPIVQPRLRVLVGGEIALGPGKAELLEHVRQTGSIREAAARMGMSYMRAWTLVRTMNQCFKKPLIIAARGGAGGGGAKLTGTGLAALAIYQGMEQATLQATIPGWRELEKLLRKTTGAV